MGRFLNDFSQIYSSMGGVNALRLILLPRVCARLHSDWYSFDNEVNRLIQRKFGYIADKYANVQISDISTDIPNIIWVFWWQGEENMPPVIRECYRSVIRNANGREIRLLSQDNYMQYVRLPDVIERKFKEKIISFPHYSDILRLQLLIKYGGLWIDAAVFATKTIEITNCRFYSPRVSDKPTNTPHLSLWVIGLMAAAPGCPLFHYAYEMLIAYWKEFNGVFHYLMFDYFIRYGYEHLTWIKELIDDRPISSPQFFSTRYTFDKEVDNERLEYLIKHNSFFSLTYRIPYPMQTADGKATYYAALLKKYL